MTTRPQVTLHELACTTEKKEEREQSKRQHCSGFREPIKLRAIPWGLYTKQRSVHRLYTKIEKCEQAVHETQKCEQPVHKTQKCEQAVHKTEKCEQAAHKTEKCVQPVHKNREV